MNRRVVSIAGIVMVLSVSMGVMAQTTDKKKVKRGEYLATVSGCHDCHSPKIYSPEGVPSPDGKRLLSGHPADLQLPSYSRDMVQPGQWVLFNEHFTAVVGPWGVTYSANLTPDDQTGIGLWTEEHFRNALRSGKHMGEGRPILPPMPWPSVGQMSDEDLSAIFAYMKSLPPVKNPVPAPVLFDPPQAQGKPLQ